MSVVFGQRAAECRPKVIIDKRNVAVVYYDSQDKSFAPGNANYKYAVKKSFAPGNANHKYAVKKCPSFPVNLTGKLVGKGGFHGRHSR